MIELELQLTCLENVRLVLIQGAFVISMIRRTDMSLSQSAEYPTHTLDAPPDSYKVILEAVDSLLCLL